MARGFVPNSYSALKVNEAAPRPRTISRLLPFTASATRIRCVGLGRLSTRHKAVPYGLIRFPVEYLAAKKEKFPNANSFVLGGCMVSPASPKIRRPVMN